MEEGSYDFEVNVREEFVRGLRWIAEYLPAHLHKSRGHRFSLYFSRNSFHSHTLFTLIRKHDRIEGMVRVVEAYYDRNPREAVKRFRAGMAARERAPLETASVP